MASPANPSNPPSPTSETSTIIPFTNYSPESPCVLLNNIRHIAKHHGFNLEELHPKVFVSSGEIRQESLPFVDTSAPAQKKDAWPSIVGPIFPTPEDVTIIPITEESPESTANRICLNNIRHVAKHHGVDLKMVHPDFFTSSSRIPGQSSAPTCKMLSWTMEGQATFNDFKVGNAVEREWEIAELDQDALKEA